MGFGNPHCTGLCILSSRGWYAVMGFNIANYKFENADLLQKRKGFTEKVTEGELRKNDHEISEPMQYRKAKYFAHLMRGGNTVLHLIIHGK